MLLLDGGPGGEAFVAMPVNYEVRSDLLPLGKVLRLPQKAVTAATEKFSVPKDTHIVRLTCDAANMPYIGNHAGVSEVFMWVIPNPFVAGSVDWKIAFCSTDNDSYHYACAGKHVARLNVRIFEKNVCYILHPEGKAKA